MAIIRFFASARQLAGVDRLEAPTAQPVTLRAALEDAGWRLKRNRGIFLGGPALFAINQRIAGLEEMVSDSDEIAVLPPMSGGL